MPLFRPVAMATAITALLLFSGLGPAPAPASITGATQGDVNCDAAVTSIDSLQILRSVAGMNTSAGCLADSGDVDCDGAVDSVDSLRILRYVAGLSSGAQDSCVPIGDPLTAPPLSEDLIAAALEAANLDYETSLLYRAYALYGDPRLPEEYQSPRVNIHVGRNLFNEIDLNEAALSSGLLEDLEPFRARPNDPDSIWNNPPGGTGLARNVLLPTWISQPAAGGKARVWVREGSSSSEDLASYAATVTAVWDSLRALIREPIPDEITEPLINPDSAIDIYFADLGDVDQRMAGCPAQSGRGGVPVPGAGGCVHP